MIKALFQVARNAAPSIVFIDEADAIFRKRSDNEDAASRNVLNCFLSEIDGFETAQKDRVLVIAATNRPFEFDAAALRRFPRRLYIGLPTMLDRVSMLQQSLKKDGIQHTLTPTSFQYFLL